MRRRRLMLGALGLVAGRSALGGLATAGGPGASRRPLEGVRRAVFLGDSITYAGQYVAYVEAILLLLGADSGCEFLNLGLPSETASGLSEPGHAGGQFPRPAVGERLDRVLARTRPGLVVACYGMNDGIYHPPDEGRFERYRAGIAELRRKAEAAQARVLHLTPPAFDPEPIRARTLPAGRESYPAPYVGYDEVLERYSEWLLSQRGRGWDVVDVHGPMARRIADGRRKDPGFRLADDGVHIDARGHWLIARELLSHWGFGPEVGEASGASEAVRRFPNGEEVLGLVERRQRLLKDAWLTAVGHRRPGMSRGEPLEGAERKAAEVGGRIRRALGAGRGQISQPLRK